MRKFFILLSITFICYSLPQQTVLADNPGHKCVRGVGNILSGWLEIPLSIYETSFEENSFIGMTYGLAKGFGKAIARTSVGVYELLSFPLPFPENYRPIIEPEFAFEKEI